MYSSKEYAEHVKKTSPRSPVLKNSVKAFFVGGAICALGQALFFIYLNFADEKEAQLFVTVTLIAAAAFLTGLGVFNKIARFAGAGTLVPVTGFANSVVSPAIDNKKEGFILGLGPKIFTVAGPVILYSVLSGALYGIILYAVEVFKKLS